MNVQELIAELQKHPPGMRVIVRGYEGGYHDLSVLKTLDIRLNANSEDQWYYGRYDNADYPFGDHPGSKREAALLIY